MTPGPRFALTRNGKSLHEVAIGSESVRSEPRLEVNELQPYGFQIESREPDTEYSLWLGDVEAGRAMRMDQTPASTIGLPRGPFVFWDDAAYFEGARGPVWIRLRSRDLSQTSKWHDRASLSVVVASGKLSSERYATMFAQMSGLAAGLVLDLVSKSTRSTRVSLLSHATQVRTSALELRILESLWPAVAEDVRRIAQSPACSLRRRFVVRNCWGSERLDVRSIAALVQSGSDPRRRGARVPFRTQVHQIEESLDTTEHRAIRGFLELLHQRASECHANLMRHIEAIEHDRQWRDRTEAQATSVYALEDVPRLQQLRSRLKRAVDLMQQIARAFSLEPFAQVRPALELKPTPVFTNVEPYRRIHRQMIRFMRTGLIVVEEGVGERIKSTSRLYEQWVFLQLAAAFRRAGMRCASQHGILHTSSMFRFTLDLDRDARITFTKDGRAVVLRYEPWVMPRTQAVQNRDSVYRGREGDAAWSPDILIEFLADGGNVGAAAVVEYAVVVDAKYTRAVRDHHWHDTTKYLEIRGTATGRQVVRQQWIAFPGIEQSEPGIYLRDSSVRWSDRGPDCPRDETLQGVLALAPATSLEESDARDGWIEKPEADAEHFVTSLLRYMDFDVATSVRDSSWNEKERPMA